ncbi:MAG TPA: Maf family protein [Candidatus Cloacimonas sp.]|nr:Maf family protein [Candidatus Cloacimonas sp.]
MIHELLHYKKVILASLSPRRKELFSLLGISFTAIPAELDETINNEAPQTQAMQNALRKAQIVKDKVNKDALVVSADTLVALDNHILGKPANAEEAGKYLRLLSGRSHSVYTGICIYYNDLAEINYEQTFVTFAELSEAEINSYIATGEPLDKAGAYGIQGFGAQFITKVEGCYFNVMGFPIRLFYDMLKSNLGKEEL